jgi:hypothetical protein
MKNQYRVYIKSRFSAVPPYVVDISAKDKQSAGAVAMKSFVTWFTPRTSAELWKVQLIEPVQEQGQK